MPKFDPKVHSLNHLIHYFKGIIYPSDTFASRSHYGHVRPVSFRFVLSLFICPALHAGFMSITPDYPASSILVDQMTSRPVVF